MVVKNRKMSNNKVSGKFPEHEYISVRHSRTVCHPADSGQELFMNTTITIGDALLILVGVCAAVLLIYLIRAVRHLIPALKALSKILEDTQVVTGMISHASKGVEDTVMSISESSADMAEFIKENQSSFKALVSLVNALVAIKKLFS